MLLWWKYKTETRLNILRRWSEQAVGGPAWKGGPGVVLLSDSFEYLADHHRETVRVCVPGQRHICQIRIPIPYCAAGQRTKQNVRSIESGGRLRPIHLNIFSPVVLRAGCISTKQYLKSDGFPPLPTCSEPHTVPAALKRKVENKIINIKYQNINIIKMMDSPHYQPAHNHKPCQLLSREK